MNYAYASTKKRRTNSRRMIKQIEIKNNIDKFGNYDLSYKYELYIRH